ncbi:hypothetical protein G6L28_19985 [Agrobacterium larrymoorei]|uniref:hypothetical protein n=1 Tax=Agrobacterium larrymoorei TaxID=160699 RepID=UPI0015717E8C|nr:hypothetical protein [Agrobacterium larrymoorei]NTJ44876.1 hypothetical protein [Agrobacterium larrymoorei]
MSLHHGHQNPGIFLNEDMQIVQSAFDQVLGERWEAIGPSGSEVARYVLRMYDRGIVDPVQLARLACLHFRGRNIVHI